MEIDIPDTVQFMDTSVSIKEAPWSERTVFFRLCFRHAVLRAIAGVAITVELSSKGFVDCDQCDKESGDEGLYERGCS